MVILRDFYCVDFSIVGLALCCVKSCFGKLPVDDSIQRRLAINMVPIMEQALALHLVPMLTQTN